MNQLWAIAKNTFLQSIRQPVYGIIVLVTLGGIALAPSMTGWTLDDDNKMLRDVGLSTLLIQGLFLACFVASGILDSEIEDKTVLTVVAKPISRPVFIFGKYVGLFGALLSAHYLALVAFLMSMRHGVLQTAAESSDVTVLILGPGVMVLCMIFAGVLNFVYGWRFLPAMFTLALPALTIGGIILLVVDRDFKFAVYETTQDIGIIPQAAVQPGVLKDIVTLRGRDNEMAFAGHEGQLVRSNWKGPISDEDRAYLLTVVDDVQWRKNINFLTKSTRKVEGFEVIKASALILGAIAMMGATALAAATRFSVVPTFLINMIIVMVGLSSDQLIKTQAENGAKWAEYLYPLVPNFQFFWMIDALEESRLIPLGYIANSLGYAALFVVALLLLAMSLFETREVG
ncbi:MAG: ABC transporter permease [Planctomycetes bacterium]|nr:ABC transporter permease [Planctomycetota bacterium]